MNLKRRSKAKYIYIFHFLSHCDSTMERLTFYSHKTKKVDFDHYLTCSWYVFTNSESMNPLFFCLKVFNVVFLNKADFFNVIKIFAKTIYFHKKRHCPDPFKGNKTFFMKKILGFLIQNSWKYVTSKLKIRTIMFIVYFI